VIMTRDQLVARLRRAGRTGSFGRRPGGNRLALRHDSFPLPRPGWFRGDYSGLTDYFKAIRAAFDGRSIRRGIIVAEGKYITCQNQDSQ
jgi:hypothetical protein